MSCEYKKQPCDDKCQTEEEVIGRFTAAHHTTGFLKPCLLLIVDIRHII